MAVNNTLSGDDFVQRKVKLFIVQVLVVIFLCINMLLIITFLKKECFYTTARYILFALTLLSDSLLLFLSDILLIFANVSLYIQVWVCIIFCTLIVLYTAITPVTLTVMTLERYVAICMPLRHGELCSTRGTIHCILIIHGISSVSGLIILSTVFVSTSLSFYKQYKMCLLEMFTFYVWQQHVRSAIYQLQFLIMCIVILFCYVKIMKVAKAASGEDKKSTSKGLKTVVLHGFQLLLCLIQLWCPFIEEALPQVKYNISNNIRFFNYITFYIAPRCLSPLIYGLRDEAFFHALKNVASFGLYKRNMI